MVSSGLDGISFLEHDGPGTAAMVDRLIWIWAQESPNGDVGLRRRLALRQTGCKGFRCLTASSDDAIIGYAYGMYNGRGTGVEPGSVISLGSHDLLAELIARENQNSLIRTDPDWLAAYDIAEVQVLADHRSRGIGEALVRKLCRSLPADDRVVLTVEPQNTTAQRVYERVGFRDLYGVPVISRLLALNPQVLMGLGRAGDA